MYKALAFLLTLGVLFGFSTTAFSQQNPEISRKITEDFIKARTLDLMMSTPENVIKKESVPFMLHIVSAYQAEQLYIARKLQCLKMDPQPKACKGEHAYFREPLIPHPMTGKPVHKSQTRRSITFFVDRIIEENNRLIAVQKTMKLGKPL